MSEIAIKQHLLEKREELIWALSLQEYTLSEIGIIFGIKHRMTVLRIIERRPKNWEPKWKKI